MLLTDTEKGGADVDAISWTSPAWMSGPVVPANIASFGFGTFTGQLQIDGSVNHTEFLSSCLNVVRYAYCSMHFQYA